MQGDWKTEFPAFIDQMPDVPRAWVDSSWHNEVSPSFTIAARQEGDTGLHDEIRIWIEDANPDHREAGPDAPRFLVQAIAWDAGIHLDLYQSNNWAECLQWTETRRLAGEAYARVIGYNAWLDDAADFEVKEAFSAIAYNLPFD